MHKKNLLFGSESNSESLVHGCSLVLHCTYFYLRTVLDATTVCAVNCTWTPKLFGNHPSAHFQALCIPVIQGHALINTQKSVSRNKRPLFQVFSGF